MSATVLTVAGLCGAAALAGGIALLAHRHRGPVVVPTVRDPLAARAVAAFKVPRAQTVPAAPQAEAAQAVPDAAVIAMAWAMAADRAAELRTALEHPHTGLLDGTETERRRTAIEAAQFAGRPIDLRDGGRDLRYRLAAPDAEALSASLGDLEAACRKAATDPAATGDAQRLLVEIGGILAKADAEGADRSGRPLTNEFGAYGAIAEARLDHGAAARRWAPFHRIEDPAATHDAATADGLVLPLTIGGALDVLDGGFARAHARRAEAAGPAASRFMTRSSSRRYRR
jgi:hypothetical protein